MTTTEETSLQNRRETTTPDRRRRTSPWYAFRGGRRKGPRRAGERPSPGSVDGLARPVAVIAGLMMGLSLVDALVTLWLLERGCEEANPAMRCLIDRGPGVFLAGKLALTALGIVFLLNFRYHKFLADSLRIGHMLLVLTGLYAALNVYQAVLMASV